MSGSLTHSPAEVMRRVLIDLGHGTDPSADGTYPIIVGQEPDEPDNVITLRDTPGTSSGYHQPTSERQEHHGFQVRVRDMKDWRGYKKADDIAIALDQSILLRGIDVPDNIGTGTSSYLVYAATITSGIFHLGTDVETGRRHLFTINAKVALKQTA